MYIKRNLTEAFSAANDYFPVLLLTGPRQVGKSTFLTHIAEPNRKYITLDDINLRIQAQEDPQLFLRNNPPPVIIDEIQYAPELFPYIKIAVDEARRSNPLQANGLYWLTGSQQFSMMKNVSESLAGRVGVFQMHGLSLQERMEVKKAPFLPPTSSAVPSAKFSENELYSLIWRGNYPGAKDFPDDRIGQFYNSYIQTYLERDISALTQVADKNTFYRFLQAVAARQGQLLKYDSIAQDAGISQPTARQWMNILVASGIVYLLQPYSSNLNKRLTSMPKIYMLDGGLAAYLSRWSSAEVLCAGNMNGAYFEAWCIAEILKSYWNNGQEPPVLLYRDRDKHEIDLLIEKDGCIYPVEFKKAANIKKDDIKNFAILQKEKLKIGMGALVSMYDSDMLVTEDCRNVYAGSL